MLSPTRVSDQTWKQHLLEIVTLENIVPGRWYFPSNKLDQKKMSSAFLGFLVVCCLKTMLSYIPQAWAIALRPSHPLHKTIPTHPLSSPLKPSQNPREFVYGRERVIDLTPPCIALIYFWLKQNKAQLSFVSQASGGGGGGVGGWVWHSDPHVL